MLNRGKDGIEEIIEEKKVTLYRMHPDQVNNFGAIIVAPNIPNSPEKMKDYARRGCRLSLDNLPWLQEHNAKIEVDSKGEPWAVPKGYKLIETKTELREPLPERKYVVTGHTMVSSVVKEEPEAPLYVSNKDKKKIK